MCLHSPEDIYRMMSLETEVLADGGRTFLLASAQAPNRVSRNPISPFDHCIQTLIPKFVVQASLHDGKQVLPIHLSRALVFCNAPIKPSDGPLHCFPNARTHSKTGN